MAKKIKPVNQFAAPSEGVQAGAPVETPAPTVRVKRDGTPFKVRGPSGPHTVNPQIVEFRANEKKALADFLTGQKGSRTLFMRDLRIESEAAKLQTRMEKRALDMTAAELEWLKNQAAAILDAKKSAKAGAQELEQHP